MGAWAPRARLFLAEPVELHDLGANAGSLGRRALLSGRRPRQSRRLRAGLDLRWALMGRLVSVSHEVWQSRSHVLARKVVGGAWLAELQAELGRGIVERLHRLEGHHEPLGQAAERKLH